MQATNTSWDWLVLLALFCTPLSAQDNCYEKTLNDGLSHLARQEYGRALLSFRTARSTCPNIPADNQLDALIQRTLREETLHLQRLNYKISDLLARTQVQAKQEADALRAADQAEGLVKDARQDAVQAREAAITSARQAATARISMLSEVELETGNKKNAFVLAAFALQLSEREEVRGSREMTLNARRAFAAAVNDSLSATYPGYGLVTDFAVTGDVLTILADEAIVRYNLTTHEQLSEPVPARKLLLATPESVLFLSKDETTPQLITVSGTVEFRGHREAVKSALQLPDQRYLTAGRDGRILCWSVAGELLSATDGHVGNVYALSLGKDGKEVYSRASDGTVRIWQTNDLDQPGKVVAEPNGYVYSMSTKEAALSYGTANGSILFHEGGQIHRARHGRLPIIEVVPAFDRNTSFLSRDLSTDLVGWSAVGEESYRLTHPAPVTAASCTVDGQIISTDGSRMIYRWLNGEEVPVLIEAHAAAVLDIFYEPTLGRLASIDQAGTGVIYDDQYAPISRFRIYSAQPKIQISTQAKRLAFVDPDGKSIRTLPFASDVWEQMRGEVDRILSPNLISKYALEEWVTAQ